MLQQITPAVADSVPIDNSQTLTAISLCAAGWVFSSDHTPSDLWRVTATRGETTLTAWADQLGKAFAVVEQQALAAQQREGHRPAAGDVSLAA